MGSTELVRIELIFGTGDRNCPKGVGQLTGIEFASVSPIRLEAQCLHLALIFYFLLFIKLLQVDGGVGRKPDRKARSLAGSQCLDGHGFRATTSSEDRRE